MWLCVTISVVKESSWTEYILQVCQKGEVGAPSIFSAGKGGYVYYVYSALALEFVTLLELQQD